MLANEYNANTTRCNQIGLDRAKVLAECFQMNTTLTQLDLRQNRIGDDVAVALAHCLKMNVMLMQLDCIINDICVDGAKAQAFNTATTHSP